MGFDIQQAGLERAELSWLEGFLPNGSLEGNTELFAGVVEDISSNLHTSKKGCLVKVKRAFDAAQKLRSMEKSQMQEIMFEPACHKLEGLYLAVKGCALKKGDRKLVPRGTTLTSGIQQAGAELEKGNEEVAKKIFSLLARNVLLKKDRIAPFENLSLPDNTELRLKGWATALKLLNSDYRRK